MTEDPTFDEVTAASWAAVRRHAVPRSMIEAVAERRAAGDHRGARAAGGVDERITPGGLPRRHRARLEADLRDLQPDLLRWHLPRILGGRSSLATRADVLLARYGRRGPYLKVRLTEGTTASQRVTLCLGGAESGKAGFFPVHIVDWTAERALWSAPDAPALADRFTGGGVPFFHPDGTRKEGPVTHAERVILLQSRGLQDAAWEEAGVEIGPDVLSAVPFRWLYRTPLTITDLVDEVARTGVARTVAAASRVALVLRPGRRRPKLTVVDSGSALPAGLEHRHRRLPDVDLLRLGRITPDRLHPLVAAALFPDLPVPAQGPPPPDPYTPVPVRCRGEWHLATAGSGSAEHTGDEHRREAALRALGGVSTGCFAVEQSWRNGRSWLPKELRAQRRALFLHALHGDGPAVRAYLDAGRDPQVRDGNRRTLLHMLYALDHTDLLPRLLAAGLSLEDRDIDGRTPLQCAVGMGGSRAYVAALLAAGARTDCRDDHDRGLARTLAEIGRTDLEGLL